MSELKAKALGGSIGSGRYKKDEEIKLSDLPEFDGTLDPEVYLDWERRVDRIFSHKDEEEQKISKFLVGLNMEIGHKVGLQSFFTFDEACELAVKVERQIKTSKLKSFRPNYAPKGETSKGLEKSENWEKNKGVSDSFKFDAQGKNQRVDKDEIKCFKCQGRGHYKSECPNRRVMTLTRYQALEEEDAKLALLLKEQREEEGNEYDFEEEFEEQPLWRWIGLKPLPPKFEPMQHDGRKAISLSTYDEGGSSKRKKKDKQQDRVLQLV
uniref:CCHC-type domain-containing protein n=1 Tax=Chenopodium quinoa TaxID=63459 RepID=A0A803NC47_CHEQI